MPFCAQCGSEAQGSFCPSCGARVDAAPAVQPQANPGGSSSPTALEDHIVSALCYVAWPLTGVLFLVLEPYNRSRTVRFHAFQSILVFAALFAGLLAWRTTTGLADSASTDLSRTFRELVKLIE